MIPNAKEQIDDIMDNFDFRRVAEVMDKLDWTWGFSKEVPSESEIRRSARKSLELAAQMWSEEQDFIACGTGGFMVQVIYGQMQLMFVIEEFYSYEGLPPEPDGPFFDDGEVENDSAM